MPDDRDAAVAAFVERMTETAVRSGLPRMPARTFATLLAAPGGSMTAAELATSMQVSAAAVSGAVRYLTQVGMVVRRRPAGERRDSFSAVEDWFTLVADRDRLLDEWADALRDGRRAVGARTAAGRRLGETAEFFAFLRTELEAVMDRWAERQRRTR